MQTQTHQVMKKLILAGLAAAAVTALSGCCSPCCKSKPCPACAEKSMSGNMMPME